MRREFAFLSTRLHMHNVSIFFIKTIDLIS